MEDWISVLKLTAMWQFTKLRRVAIDKLTPLLKAADIPVRWLGLARQYDVHEWLFDALYALVHRRETLRLDEVEPLGIATVMKIVEIREEYLRTRSSYPNMGDTSSEIRRLFKEELEAAAPKKKA